MQVRIIRREFCGVEFRPEQKVLHLGGQTSAGVEQLQFELPEEWEGCAVTLHIQRQDGTLPTPILLDEENSAAVGREFTASACGSWMLLALGEDGYRALTRPARYDCYETLATDGTAQISPTQYEAFVAQVLSYANSAQSSAKEARNQAQAAKEAADQAGAQAKAAQTDREAAESAAEKAEDCRAAAQGSAADADASREAAGAQADAAKAAAEQAEESRAAAAENRQQAAQEAENAAASALSAQQALEKIEALLAQAGS